MRGSSRLFGGPAILQQGGRVHVAKATGPCINLVAEPVQQAGYPFGVVAADDRTDVRQRLDVAKRPRGEVQTVDDSAALAGAGVPGG